jgi:hypothetical protein
MKCRVCGSALRGDGTRKLHGFLAIGGFHQRSGSPAPPRGVSADRLAGSGGRLRSARQWRDVPQACDVAGTVISR